MRAFPKVSFCMFIMLSFSVKNVTLCDRYVNNCEKTHVF